jgi:hypothetical protein
VEVSPEQQAADMVHVVVCKKEGSGGDLRNLNQAGHIFVFANKDDEDAHREFFRRHVHWTPQVFEIASKVVAHLGLFQYSSAHIRRNELQYKDVFFSGEKLANVVLPQLDKKETIYIASDESDPTYFAPFAQGHTVVRWADVAPETPGSPLHGVTVPTALIGPIEQVICAAGRKFFGTFRSTFTSHIFRLHRYIQAPDIVERLVSGDLPQQTTEAELNPASELDEIPDFWHEGPSFSA